jgi:hypothetical protein
MIRKDLLLRKIEAYIESRDVLGVDIGDEHRVLTFLARLEMGAAEALLPPALTARERELVLNWIEERKGELSDGDLPLAEARRRAEDRKPRQRRWLW